MNEESIKQLKIIKWLLVTILLVFLVMVGSVAAVSIFSMYVYEDISDAYYDADCETEGDYIDKVDELIDDKMYDEAISVSESYIEKNPNSHNGYWYSGIAYYLKGNWEEAIYRMDKVEKLAPDWKNRWIEPYRFSAQKKMIESKQKVDS
jgi:tetratricopeptide (TPR) repeat protein